MFKKESGIRAGQVAVVSQVQGSGSRGLTRERKPADVARLVLELLNPCSVEDVMVGELYYLPEVHFSSEKCNMLGLGSEELGDWD